MLVALHGEGLTGYGDAAPLPSSGEAGHAAVFAALAEAVRAMPGMEVAEALGPGLANITDPQARWAIETALTDLAARQAGKPLCRYLSPEAVSSVAVNAALGRPDGGCEARALRAVEAGFAVGKIKVGVAPLEEELAVIQSLAEAAGDRLALRFDANRAFPPDLAHRFLDAISGMDGLCVDGVEEPLADPTPEGLAALQAGIAFPLAADESLPLLGVDALLSAGAVRRLVVKPARIGGMRRTLELAEKAGAAGVELVLTSVVDSALGVMAAAHLAAALTGGGGLAHGFDTLSWLAEDVAEAPQIGAGRLLLPAGPGLGLVPFDNLPGGKALQG